MQRRTLLARAGLVGVVGLAGCLSQFTGGGAQEFRPAVESFNRGVDAFERAESTRSAAEKRYADEQWGGAAQRYTAARDGYDAAAVEFDRARSATSGRCVAVHDRAVRQYRRSLALAEACAHWADAATARSGGLEPADDERRAEVWRDRAAQYPSASRFDPEQFSCRV